MSKLETNTIDNISGSSTLTIGDSNTSIITLKSGATLTNFPDNTPAFFVSKTDGDQTVNDSSATKVTFNNEIYDTANAFSSSTFTVPSGQGGKYSISTGVTSYDGGGSLKRQIVYIYVNGSGVSQVNNDFGERYVFQMYSFQTVNLSLSASDTVEIYALNDTNDSSTSVVVSNASKYETWVQGFKIIE
jgi:hypothetical protein|tara:strand:+ start:20 stop:583 length:564 start_codon:yes stop_codon:yes gene_type:complete